MTIEKVTECPSLPLNTTGEISEFLEVNGLYHLNTLPQRYSLTINGSRWFLFSYIVRVCRFYYGKPILQKRLIQFSTHVLSGIRILYDKYKLHFINIFVSTSSLTNI